jgi:hypothetical protein
VLAANPEFDDDHARQHRRGGGDRT